MPEFSTSLGCSDASHFFQGEKNIVYSIAVNPSRSEHRLDIHGGAVGTLLLTQGAPDDDEIKVDVSVRGDQQGPIDQVSVYTPTADEVVDGLSNSRLRLMTPNNLAGGCMRYDMTLRVPSNLKNLRIESVSVLQLKFDPNAKLDLDVLSVVMQASGTPDLILPTKDIHAAHLSLEMTHGWMYGEVSISEKTSLYTQRGDAISNVKIYPLPSFGETIRDAELQTTTGHGRSDFTWIGNPGAPHRRIESVHRSSRWGDLYLTYKGAEFNGRVDVAAKAYSASGISGMGLSRSNESELPWVGDKEGGDLVKVRSEQGWVGLYF